MAVCFFLFRLFHILFRFKGVFFTSISGISWINEIYISVYVPFNEAIARNRVAFVHCAMTHTIHNHVGGGSYKYLYILLIKAKQKKNSIICAVHINMWLFHLRRYSNYILYVCRYFILTARNIFFFLLLLLLLLLFLLALRLDAGQIVYEETNEKKW